MPSERIKSLIRAYFDDTITAAEKDELAEYVRQSGQDDILLKLLADAWAQHVPNATMPEGITDRILSNILPGAVLSENQATPPETKAGIYRIRSGRWIAAASFIVLCSIGALYLDSRKTANSHITPNPLSEASAEKDIMPGSQKAILTLANGSRIMLDSAHSGNLARQGSAQLVKLSDNRLSYRASNEQYADIVYNTMVTPRGGQYQLILADGTKVWLNSASSIHYPTAFSGKDRHVEISGEAYFEVAKDPVRPFTVKLNDSLSIRVLGTHFNVNSYPEESHISTTLLEGSIHMMHGNQETSMVAGEQAQLTKKGTLTIVNQVNLEEIMAWKNGYFQFSGTDLPAVMRQVARWYDIDVQYTGKIPEDRLTGKISMGVSLSRLKKWLEWSDIHFKVNGRTMIVSP